MRLSFFFLVLISFQVEARVNQKLPAFFSYGASLSNINAPDVSSSATSINLAYRQEFSFSTNWAWSTQGIPLIRSGFSLLGVQGSLNIGYKIIGSTSREEYIYDKGAEILKLKKNKSRWLGYLDAGYAITPFFGDKTTSTFSGAALGASIYHFGEIPLEYAIRYTQQNTGARQLTILSFTFSLVKIF